MERLQPRRVIVAGTALKYVIVGVGGAQEQLEEVLGYLPSGRSPFEIFNEDVLPVLGCARAGPWPAVRNCWHVIPKVESQMDKEAWGVVQSFISAAFGLAGVWYGARLTNQREEKREVAERRQAAAYLATLVLAHLERFVDGCLDVAYDDGTSEGRPSGEDGYCQATTRIPEFEPLELKADWKAISVELMHEILNVPHRTHELKRYLSDPGFDDPPDHGEYFWTRQYEFAKLGLYVIALADRLRTFAELPAPLPGPYERTSEAILLERKQHLDEVRRVVEERRAAAAVMMPPPPAPSAAA